MAKTFDSKMYLTTLAQDLISEFNRAALATHPGAIGSGREKSVRNQLESILPNGVGVGSGFVFDSTGVVSKQCDIIIFEKQYAISYAINDDASNAYYNCECVIAVGEVKSTVTKNEIDDSLKKFRSVRQLERYNPDPTVFRCYLSMQTLQGAPSEAYSPKTKSKDQIFTFLYLPKAIREGQHEVHECFNRYYRRMGIYSLLPKKTKPLQQWIVPLGQIA